jgi:predicted metal-dependent hydrolase
VKTVSSISEYALKTGINLFNEGKYFDAHEAWEGPWRGAWDAKDKRFLQGLIMAAAAFFHARKRECDGATALLGKSIPLLRSGLDSHPELQLNDFISALEKLGESTEWCTTAANGRALPRMQAHSRRGPPHPRADVADRS